ncbi:MurR/RpiR family transcriptional regulator [Salinibacterium sp. G-O1]|uniref:MurR/RpiR family transcriptional regulator n=1 Tax=Salinibacterium sp. G-O1 TaxID=3046208 RepID=UPI0024BB76D5|nr:MurR/RpiR family transcriptional regulator [Salinibacterium sp. G-O1]MDJ0334563.1 MurR/RpiR family transcriptional regulator [Salinibacterium sp. G-O1]
MATMPAPHSGPAIDVVNRIRAKLPEMSETMSRIAHLLLEHPDAPLTSSIGELAARAGTSAATVTRFCALIGYSGYVPFRVSIATDLGRRSSRVSWKTDIGRAFGPLDSASDVLSTLVNAHTRSIRETAASMDLPVMKSISKRIADCRHLDIYGVGGGATLALELQSRLYRIGIDSHHWSEVHAGLASAAIQDSDCVAIGISNTGRTEETIQMLRQAKKSGALTIAISNNPTSPLSTIADVKVVTSAYEQFLQPDDLSAKHVQLLVLDLLYLLVAQENFDRTTANLARSASAVASHRRPHRRSADAVRSDISQVSGRRSLHTMEKEDL